MIAPIALALLTAGLIAAGQSYRLEPGPVSIGFMFALPFLLCYTLQDRPLRFGLGMGAILLASGLYAGVHGRPDLRVRSFFGMG